MLEHDLVRAAQDIASSEAIDEVFRRLEDEYTRAWKASPPSNLDQREQSYRMVLALNALRTELKSLADSERVKAWNRRNLAADTTLR